MLTPRYLLRLVYVRVCGVLLLLGVLILSLVLPDICSDPSQVPSVSVSQGLE